jgi:hypothetical protein
MGVPMILGKHFGTMAFVILIAGLGLSSCGWINDVTDSVTEVDLTASMKPVLEFTIESDKISDQADVDIQQEIADNPDLAKYADKIKSIESMTVLAAEFIVEDLVVIPNQNIDSLEWYLVDYQTTIDENTVPVATSNPITEDITNMSWPLTITGGQYVVPDSILESQKFSCFVKGKLENIESFKAKVRLTLDVKLKADAI